MLHAPPISVFLIWSPEWYFVRSTEHKATLYVVFSKKKQPTSIVRLRKVNPEVWFDSVLDKASCTRGERLLWIVKAFWKRESVVEGQITNILKYVKLFQETVRRD